MPWVLSDKAIWLVLLFSAGFASSYIPATLHKVKNLSEVPGSLDDAPSKQLQKDAEKALSLSTLKTLSDGYSHDIRTAATRIATNRALNSHAKQLLLADLASTDGERRGKAICALDILISRPLSVDRDVANHFANHASMNAIVDAFQNLLPLHVEMIDGGVITDLRPASPVYPPNRPAQEKKLLRVVNDLLYSFYPDSLRNKRSQMITCIVEAGLVTRWLKDYPFPCARPDNQKFRFKKADVCNLFDHKAWGSDDELMGPLVHVINRHPLGMKQLYEAGLRTDPRAEDCSHEYSRWQRIRLPDVDSDVRMINGESTAGDVTLDEAFDHLLDNLLDSAIRGDSASPEQVTQRPFSSLSPEEENARRRRREAIVVADAGMPLRRENILERQDSRIQFPTRTQSNMPDDTAIDDTLQEAMMHSDVLAPLERSEASHPQESHTAHEEVVYHNREASDLSLTALLQEFGRPQMLSHETAIDETLLSEPTALRSDDVERLRLDEAQGEAVVNGRLRARNNVAQDPEHAEDGRHEDAG